MIERRVPERSTSARFRQVIHYADDVIPFLLRVIFALASIDIRNSDAPLEVRANTCSSMRVDSFVRSLNLDTAIPRADLRVLSPDSIFTGRKSKTAKNTARARAPASATKFVIIMINGV